MQIIPIDIAEKKRSYLYIYIFIYLYIYRLGVCSKSCNSYGYFISPPISEEIISNVPHLSHYGCLFGSLRDVLEDQFILEIVGPYTSGIPKGLYFSHFKNHFPSFERPVLLSFECGF